MSVNWATTETDFHHKNPAKETNFNNKSPAKRQTSTENALPKRPIPIKRALNEIIDAAVVTPEIALCSQYYN